MTCIDAMISEQLQFPADRTHPAYRHVGEHLNICETCAYKKAMMFIRSEQRHSCLRSIFLHYPRHRCVRALVHLGNHDEHPARLDDAQYLTHIACQIGPEKVRFDSSDQVECVIRVRQLRYRALTDLGIPAALLSCRPVQSNPAI